MDKSLRAGLVSGVAASALFAYALQPLLRALGGMVASTSGMAFSAGRDAMIRAAAGHSGDAASIAVLAAVMGLMMGVVLGSTTGILRVIHVGDRAARRLSLSVLYGHKWRATAVLVIFLLFFTTVSLYSIFKPWYQAGLSATFRQHVAVLGPYLNERERLDLESRWASMQSYSDYEALYSDMSAAAAENSVTLPRNAAYGISPP